jgi:hypothetical protein
VVRGGRREGEQRRQAIEKRRERKERKAYFSLSLLSRFRCTEHPHPPPRRLATSTPRLPLSAPRNTSQRPLSEKRREHEGREAGRKGKRRSQSRGEGTRLSFQTRGSDCPPSSLQINFDPLPPQLLLYFNSGELERFEFVSSCKGGRETMRTRGPETVER